MYNLNKYVNIYDVINNRDYAVSKHLKVNKFDDLFEVSQ